MIVTAHNPSTQDLERTFLSQYMPEASGTLAVKNTDGFTSTDPVMIGRQGSERTELAVLDGLTAPNVLDLTANTSFAHNADDPVYKLRYNRVRFYRATSQNGTYTLQATVNLDVENEDKVTRYDDPTGATTHFYKITYYNTVSLEETERSDPIPATGMLATSIGKVIDEHLRNVKDVGETILGIQEYIDVANDVNDELLLQSLKPYGFLKTDITLNTVAGQDYIDLAASVTDFWKFDYLVYTVTRGGVANTYKIEYPLSLEAFIKKYRSYPWQDDDELLDVAIDEANQKILLGPGSRTSVVGAVELHYYKKFTKLDSPGDLVELPTILPYKLKFKSEYYAAKSESDPNFLRLSERYEAKYGNEVVKMQRANRVDVGTPRSFAPPKVPGMRKRYTL